MESACPCQLRGDDKVLDGLQGCLVSGDTATFDILKDSAIRSMKSNVKTWYGMTLANIERNAVRRYILVQESPTALQATEAAAARAVADRYLDDINACA